MKYVAADGSNELQMSQSGDGRIPLTQVKYTADVGREGASTKAGFFGDATFTADVRSAFAGVPRVKAQWRNRYMKVMIVGESGLGARLQPFISLPGALQWHKRYMEVMIMGKSSLGARVSCVVS